LQPIYWHKQELKEVSPGTYQTLPPKPKDGHWTGFYIEFEFSGSDMSSGSGDPNPLFTQDMFLTTPGWTWPNTLPFPDCHGESCGGSVVSPLPQIQEEKAPAASQNDVKSFNLRSTVKELAKKLASKVLLNDIIY